MKLTFLADWSKKRLHLIEYKRCAQKTIREKFLKWLMKMKKTQRECI